MASIARFLSSLKQNKKSETKGDKGKSRGVGSMAKQRLQNELKRSIEDCVSHCCYGPIDEHDPFRLQAIIVGPSDTPFDGGIFFLSIHIPQNYPFKPPEIKFQTKVFHPNVTSDGTIHIDMLKKNWTPALTIDKLLLSICSFLSNPSHESDSCNFVCHLYSKHRNLYNQIAKEWTCKYAMT